MSSGPYNDPKRWQPSQPYLADPTVWLCSHDSALICPPEGCPKSYGCARDHGWKPGDPTPRECLGLSPVDRVAVRKEERDAILFAFHKAYEKPTAAQIIDWAKRYPDYAEDIRAHAAVAHDWAAADRATTREALFAAEAAILNCHNWRSHNHHAALAKIRAALEIPAPGLRGPEGAAENHEPGSGEPAAAPQILSREEFLTKRLAERGSELERLRGDLTEGEDLLRAALNGLRSSSERDEQWNAQCGVICQQIESYLSSQPAA